MTDTTNTPKLWRDMTPDEKGARLLTRHEMHEALDACCDLEDVKMWLRHYVQNAPQMRL